MKISGRPLFWFVAIMLIYLIWSAPTQVSAVLGGIGRGFAAFGDGIAAFLPEHPADAVMRETFNRHQQRDKGFGPAAGPAAKEALAAAFLRHGYTIRRGKSPWVLDGACSVLRQELDLGWAAAVRETGLVSDNTIDDWLSHRTASASAVTIIGHEDLLALPALR